MRKLLENGVHFGHQTRRWDPKCKPFIYTAKNGIYIINLNKTQEDLQKAYDKLKEIAENGGKVLFVGTKKQAQQIVLDEATRSGSFYINQRWLGGTLTNFRTIQKRIKRLIEINEMETSGTINVYPKKEIVLIRKEATRLENFLGGIKEMKKLPDAVVVVDPKEDHNAVLEARKLHIPVFGLADTNCDPAFVDYAIPANDDAIKSIKLMMSLLADAIVEAKGGILQDAYQEGEDVEDITMEDVIINVEKHAEEQEKRRKARNEERNRQQAQNRGRFNRNSEKRYINKKENAETKTEEIKAAVEEKAEEVKAAVETKVEEVKEDLTAVKENVELKAEETAEKAADKVEEIVEKAQDKAEEVKAAVEDKVEEVKAAVEERAEEVKEEVKKTAKKVKEEVKEAVEEIKEKAEEAVEEAPKKRGRPKKVVEETKEAE